MTYSDWSEDRVEQLKALWTEGRSASQIARILGAVTRNAVIGKVHRLGLAGRASPCMKDRPRLPMAPHPTKAALASMGPPQMPADWVQEIEPVVLESGLLADVITISDRMCRWPMGDPSLSTFHFCGHTPRGKGPYCEAHARKAYQPAPQARTLRHAMGRFHSDHVAV